MEIDLDLKRLDLHALEDEDSEFEKHKWRILREIFRQGLVGYFPEDELWEKVIAWGNPYAWRALFSIELGHQDLPAVAADAILESGRVCLFAYALRFFHLPPGYWKKFLTGIVESESNFQTSAAADVLLHNPKRLSQAWFDQLCLLTQSLWRGSPEARGVIESFFGNKYAMISHRDWVAPRGRSVLRIRGQTPIFRNLYWTAEGQQQRGKFAEALLAIHSSEYGSTRQARLGNVLLLKDANGAYAYQAHPGARNIHDALVAFYGLPDGFIEFDEEV